MLSADRQCSAPASPPVLLLAPGPGLITEQRPRASSGNVLLITVSRHLGAARHHNLQISGVLLRIMGPFVIRQSGPRAAARWAHGTTGVYSAICGAFQWRHILVTTLTAAVRTKPSMTRGGPQLVLVKMSLHGCMLSVVSFIWQSKNIHPCRLQITHCTASKGAGIVGEAWTQLVLDTPQTQDLFSCWTRF